MHRTTMLAAACLCSLLLPTLAAGEPIPLTQKVQEDSFSYSIPADWEVRRVEGVNYRMAFSPLTQGKRYQNNVNCIIEPFKGTLNEYVKAARATLRVQQPQLKELDAGPFITDAPALAMRLVWDNRFGEIDVRQTTYVFSGEEVVFVFTTSVLKQEAADVSPVMDRIARSFRVEASKGPPAAAVAAEPAPKAAEPAGENRTLLSKDGHAALTTPDTWHVTWERDEPLQPKYPVAHPADEDDDFFLNALMSFDSHDGTVDEYLRDLIRGMPKAKLLEQAAFRTARGELGGRAVVQNKDINNDTVTQALFVFPSTTGKYMVVCSTSSERPAEDLKFFDKMVREGFHWRQP